ncbi:MAG: imidazole glycerol phosphate synthase subunit HisH [Lachnospiraceae bacterium]|nr:imidazole glycerol phosphate synthase subunit HisH [Lachnospiraceae bacterium]
MSSSKIAIIDYDAGNIKSVERAIAYCGGEAILTRDPKVLMDAPKVILPGVGSFGDAMDKLKKYDLIDTIHDYVKTGKPFLGICLGLQLLFDGSDESPEAIGLGLLKGYIHKIPDNLGLKVPQIGWNSLDYPNKGRLFKDIPEGSFVYFVHSYYLKAEDPSIVVATTDYGVCVHASVEKDNVFGCQFHPEKSSDVGLRIIKNFLEL